MIHILRAAGKNSERKGATPGLRSGLAPALLGLCLCWALAFGGCAGQNKKSVGSVSRSADDLAQAVVDSSPGYVQVPAGPYGRGLAAVGEPYMSALGRPCRPVIFLNENQDRYDLAVCAEQDGVWSTAPNIFAANKSR